jgi:hypothetical protein
MFHSLRIVFPKKCNNPRTGDTSSSLSAGAVWGDRQLSPPSLYQHVVFPLRAKGILESPKNHQGRLIFQTAII